MRSVRFSTRTLMIAVALAALATRGYTLWQRSRVFAAKAQIYGIRTEINQINIFCEIYGRHGFPPRKRVHYDKAKLAFFEKCERYEEFMYYKYRRLSFFPWMEVTPDPPAPPETRWIKHPALKVP